MVLYYAYQKSYMKYFLSNIGFPYIIYRPKQGTHSIFRDIQAAELAPRI
jgi:hypothetical protein